VESIERNKTSGVSRKRRVSWVLTGVGLVVLLSGVLHMTSSTVGGRVQRFSERRTYNQTKRNLYDALPVTLVLGLGGLSLMMLGGHLRRD
jgi:hypothetical protein